MTALEEIYYCYGRLSYLYDCNNIKVKDLYFLMKKAKENALFKGCLMVLNLEDKVLKNEITQIERKGEYLLQLASGEVLLTNEDVEIITEDMPGWLVANEGRLTVALDISLTDALIREGIARELVNRIQNIRKSNGYEIVDKIVVEIESRTEIADAVLEYATYISTQTLANSVELVESLSDATALDFDEYVVNIKVEKV